MSNNESIKRDRPRAMSIPDFCRHYSTGRTTTYEEIKSGRLHARKIGRRTVILADDAEAWLQSLPEMGAAK